MTFSVTLAARPALATGASGGLDEHFARLLAKSGARLSGEGAEFWRWPVAAA